MTASLLAALNEPGNLRITFQPVFELGERPDPIYALQAAPCGVAGTYFENSKLLVQYVARTHTERLLDHVCLRLACEAMLSLPEKLCVHVPVHAGTLAQDPSFVADFRHAIHEHNLEARRITIDLLDLGSEAYPIPLEVLDGLREAGARVNLVGVGFADASWRILVDRPPEFWTLSAHLANHVGDDFRKRAAVESILGLATRFGCSVIASEISRTEDLTALAMLGVRLVQADFLCPAISLDQLLTSGVL